MAFPISPTNGQQANINGITYTYSNTLPAWTVSTSVSNTFVSISVSANVNSGNILNTGLISTTGNITGGNIVTGGVTFNDNSVQNTAATGFGFKNRIINGGQVIDQRATSVTLNTAGTYMTDRWCQNNGGSAVMTGARSATGPTGLTQSSLLITTTTGSAPSAGNLVDIFQPIEGYNIADLAYGTASAQTTTVSFWVKSSLTGTFCVAYGNAGYNRSYVTTYTINSANTWEYKTVTITGDTTGTWGTTNGVGLILYFDMGSGSNFNTTANAWASDFYTRVSGATSLSATTGATWQVTGVQLEKGSTATSFDYRPYGTEYQLCQRYYSQGSVVPTYNGAAVSVAMPAFNFYGQPMRISPTVTVANGAVGYGFIQGFVVVSSAPISATSYYLPGAFTATAEL